MFDIGASELLMIVVIAVIAIGPKDLPVALRTAGRWIGKMRRISGHFRSGIETMIREAEMEDMERKWREQNDAIMAAHPVSASAEAAVAAPNPATLEAASTSDQAVDHSNAQVAAPSMQPLPGKPD